MAGIMEGEAAPSAFLDNGAAGRRNKITRGTFPPGLTVYYLPKEAVKGQRESFLRSSFSFFISLA